MLCLALSLNSIVGAEQGVEISPDKDRVLFLLPAIKGPHYARSSAKDTDVNLITASVRFITTSRVDEKSLFYKGIAKKVFLAAVTSPPNLLLHSHRYTVGKVYYCERINETWSEEKSIVVGGAYASIALSPKVKAVKVTRIQYK